MGRLRPLKNYVIFLCGFPYEKYFSIYLYQFICEQKVHQEYRFCSNTSRKAGFIVLSYLVIKGVGGGGNNVVYQHAYGLDRVILTGVNK